MCPSHPSSAAEREDVLSRLKKRAALLADGLNASPGIVCNQVAGAM